MIILKTIDVYAAASRAIVLSQRCDYLACVKVDQKFQLHECKNIEELLAEMQKGERVFSILQSIGKVLNNDKALHHWMNNQIRISNANLRMN